MAGRATKRKLARRACIGWLINEMGVDEFSTNDLMEFADAIRDQPWPAVWGGRSCSLKRVWQGLQCGNAVAQCIKAHPMVEKVGGEDLRAGGRTHTHGGDRGLRSAVWRVVKS